MTTKFEKIYSTVIPQSCPSCGHSKELSRYRHQLNVSESIVFSCNQCTFEFFCHLSLLKIEQHQIDSIDDVELFNSVQFLALYKKLVIGSEISRVQRQLGRAEYSMLDDGCRIGWNSRIWVDFGVCATSQEPYVARASVAPERSIRVLSCFAEDLYDIDIKIVLPCLRVL